MSSWLKILRDPMIAVLSIATGLAIVAPAAGEAHAIAGTISSAAIFLLFLLNGMRIHRSEIAKGLRNWRFFLPLGLWVFGAMALMGLGFARLAAGWLPPMVALGFLYLGTLPSTVQSATSYTTMANGNTALSVIGAALINIVGVFVSAPIFALLGGGAVADAGPGVIVRVALLLILPFVIGQLVQSWTWDWISQRRAQIVWTDRIVIGIAVYVAFSGAVEQGIGQSMEIGTWTILFTLVVAFLALANIGVWLAGSALGYPFKDRISFLFAGSQKSVAVGAPLAALLFPPAAAGFVIAPLLLYHLFQLVAAAPLANLLAERSG
ncbi:bile acid:sodium symporter [Erythrobacter sp. SDW2]|uniref:bile acid:sodium symporter family protein n=1 Tax=Erythrobacter sp. SDW2 TaxID=2907154 RepID=UPI001F3CC069|nr:bile acid:sodium symporter family protein [Erythrobacter sp. SDW2]UIP05923.1 bile acid:sodium symporter [Erythrobacter sp. SDW2]